MTKAIKASGVLPVVGLAVTLFAIGCACSLPFNPKSFPWLLFDSHLWGELLYRAVVSSVIVAVLFSPFIVSLRYGARYFSMSLLTLHTVFCIWSYNGQHITPKDDYVPFSNDGPLASQMSAQVRLPDCITGTWQDLNWLGGHDPGVPPLTTSTAIRIACSFIPFFIYYTWFTSAGWWAWLIVSLLFIKYRISFETLFKSWWVLLLLANVAMLGFALCDGENRDTWVCLITVCFQAGLISTVFWFGLCQKELPNQ